MNSQSRIILGFAALTAAFALTKPATSFGLTCVDLFWPENATAEYIADSLHRADYARNRKEIADKRHSNTLNAEMAKLAFKAREKLLNFEDSVAALKAEGVVLEIQYVNVSNAVSEVTAQAIFEALSHNVILIRVSNRGENRLLNNPNSTFSALEIVERDMEFFANDITNVRAEAKEKGISFQQAWESRRVGFVIGRRMKEQDLQLSKYNDFIKGIAALGGMTTYTPNYTDYGTGSVRLQMLDDRRAAITNPRAAAPAVPVVRPQSQPQQQQPVAMQVLQQQNGQQQAQADANRLNQPSNYYRADGKPGLNMREERVDAQRGQAALQAKPVPQQDVAAPAGYTPDYTSTGSAHLEIRDAKRSSFSQPPVQQQPIGMQELKQQQQQQRQQPARSHQATDAAAQRLKRPTNYSDAQDPHLDIREAKADAERAARAPAPKPVTGTTAPPSSYKPGYGNLIADPHLEIRETKRDGTSGGK